MTVKLLTEQHLEFLSSKGCCTGSSESTLVQMPHCWKSHVTAQFACFILVVLLQNGDVFCFGSNQYGQLGLGDTVIR